MLAVDGQPGGTTFAGVTAAGLTASLLCGLVAGRLLVRAAGGARAGRGRSKRRADLLGRSPLAPVLTAILWAAVAARFGASWTTPALDVFSAGLVALAGTDIDRRLLPKRIVYVTGSLVAVFVVAGTIVDGQPVRLAVAVICGAGCYGAFLAVHTCNRRWLGFGDVRLIGLIGFALGWLGVPYVLIALVVANLAGVVGAGTLMVAGRIRAGTPIPYGAFLAAGALVAVFATGPIIGLAGGPPV